MSGRCVFCGCSYFNPCPGSCGWANRDATLCTECVQVRNAFVRIPARSDDMRRPFFRGFVAGADDERALDVAPPRRSRAIQSPAPMNPYADGKGAIRRRFWQLGFERGQAYRARELARAS